MTLTRWPTRSRRGWVSTPAGPCAPGIVASLPADDASAHAVCPNFEPVMIRNAFTCTLTDAGPYTRARVTIVDGDGGFRLSFS